MDRHLLIVSATRQEVEPLIRTMNHDQVSGLFSGTIHNTTIDILVTGIGCVATTFYLTRLLSAQRHYDLVISAGIAGSFDKDISIGEVVQITQDCFADLGIDDNGTFRKLSDAGLASPDEYPYTAGWIKVPAPIMLPYRKVKGITVQTASGSDRGIAGLVTRYSPQVETMENAAFLYVCTILQVPSLSLRAISNKVERRNRNNWNIPLAIAQLDAAIRKIAGQDNS